MVLDRSTTRIFTGLSKLMEPSKCDNTLKKTIHPFYTIKNIKHGRCVAKWLERAASSMGVRVRIPKLALEAGDQTFVRKGVMLRANNDCLKLSHI